MHLAPPSLLYFSDRVDPVVEGFIGELTPIIPMKRVENADKLFNQLSPDSAFIILGEPDSYYTIINTIKRYFNETFPENILIILLGAEFSGDNEPYIFNIIDQPRNKTKLALTIKNAYSQLSMHQEIEKLRKQLTFQNTELQELNRIGVALSAEHDPEKLLELILRKSREITHADAGSLYLVEKKSGLSPDEQNYFYDKQLRFRLAHCDSVDVGFKEFVMPIERKSIAGYVALSDKVLNIPDVYELNDTCDFLHNRSFDESVGYMSKSMLVIPMKTHKSEIIGVLQLINRKKDFNVKINTRKSHKEQVIPFDEECKKLASSLASQAAVSIENNRLYEEIKNLFEGFIKASVHAIEQRDPTTSGHSERVAILTTELAKKIDSIDNDKFKAIKFSRDAIQQINYAALLHDFGKIGVRENVLVKAKKLYPADLEKIKLRFRLFKQANELKYSNAKMKYLLDAEREKALQIIKSLDVQIKEFSEELDRYLDIVIESNEPKLLKESGPDILKKIGKIEYNENGILEPLLTPEEIKCLTIPKGSLSDEERHEIESHVTHTYNFLSRIPWTSELKNVPAIAYAHHEKLDNSGYPRGIPGDQIPIQSKMMTIADIFDALTARDRPYKRAVPVEKALDILQWEVNDGKLDPDLLQVFIDAKIYETVEK